MDGNIENPGIKTRSSGDVGNEPGAAALEKRGGRSWCLVGGNNSAGRGRWTVTVPALLPRPCHSGSNC